jgi:hypothetical protein
MRTADSCNRVPRPTAIAKAFDQGVLYAVARIIELHDEPVIAADILAGSGVDLKHADEYDAVFLRPVKRELRLRKRNQQKH